MKLALALATFACCAALSLSAPVARAAAAPISEGDVPCGGESGATDVEGAYRLVGPFESDVEAKAYWRDEAAVEAEVVSLFQELAEPFQCSSCTPGADPCGKVIWHTVGYYDAIVGVIEGKWYVAVQLVPPGAGDPDTVLWTSCAPCAE